MSGEDAADDGDWTIGLEDLEEREPDPLEPGDIDLENVVFFLLGVAVALLVFAAVVL